MLWKKEKLKKDGNVPGAFGETAGSQGSWSIVSEREWK